MYGNYIIFYYTNYYVLKLIMWSIIILYINVSKWYIYISIQYMNIISFNCLPLLTDTGIINIWE